MADVHSAAIRSKNMRAIHSHDTAIEQQLAALLTDLGLDYQQQVSALPGSPDFMLPAENVIIFTHGCFWHHHHCHLFKLPATRSDFWLKKIDGNVARDQRNTARLMALGWRVLVVWECALRGKRRLDKPQMSLRLEEWILAGRYAADIDYLGLHSRFPDARST